VLILYILLNFSNNISTEKACYWHGFLSGVSRTPYYGVYFIPPQVGLLKYHLSEVRHANHHFLKYGAMPKSHA
jgi:hypothetical protein